MKLKQGMGRWMALWLIPLGAPYPATLITRQSIQSVRVLKLPSHTSYRVMSKRLSSGLQTKEYVDADGIVFGVTWQGNSHLPLEQILGEQRRSYAEGMLKYRRLPGHRAFAMESGDLVVQKWGQMRQLQGRAYLKSRMPADMNLMDLK